MCHYWFLVHFLIFAISEEQNSVVFSYVKAFITSIGRFKKVSLVTKTKSHQNCIP